MGAAVRQSERKLAQHSALTVKDLVLLRATVGATRADLQRDLAPLLAPRTSGTEFRRAAEFAIGTLTDTQLIRESKGHLATTAKGSQIAEALVAPAHLNSASWADVKLALIAYVLDARDTAAVRKALQRPQGLAALVLQNHFGISAGRVLSPANLRAALAIVALERAFGNRIKTGLGKGSGLPAKPGRVLAGQLFRQPREIASDGKLIVQLAAEVAGAREHTLDALQLAVLRGLIAPKDAAPEKGSTPARPKRTKRSSSVARTPSPANDGAPFPNLAPPVRQPSPPDMAEFCAAVMDVARPVSEGWPGNRKAFISLVWKAIRSSRLDWGLSEVAFKGMLAEAHRLGQIELASADLKDGRDLRSLEDSKILYKNTVWHYVRVQE
jgi:hypothetical protein